MSGFNLRKDFETAAKSARITQEREAERARENAAPAQHNRHGLPVVGAYDFEGDEGELLNDERALDDLADGEGRL